MTGDERRTLSLIEFNETLFNKKKDAYDVSRTTGDRDAPYKKKDACDASRTTRDRDAPYKKKDARDASHPHGVRVRCPCYTPNTKKRARVVSRSTHRAVRVTPNPKAFVARCCVAASSLDFEQFYRPTSSNPPYPSLQREKTMSPEIDTIFEVSSMPPETTTDVLIVIVTGGSLSITSFSDLISPITDGKNLTILSSETQSARVKTVSLTYNELFGTVSVRRINKKYVPVAIPGRHIFRSLVEG